MSREIQLPPGEAEHPCDFRADRRAQVAGCFREPACRRSGAESLESQRQSPGMDPERRRREGEERRHSREEAVPAVLSLERRLRFASRQVILVTYDPQRRELIAVESPPR